MHTQPITYIRGASRYVHELMTNPGRRRAPQRSVATSLTTGDAYLTRCPRDHEAGPANSPQTPRESRRREAGRVPTLATGLLKRRWRGIYRRGHVRSGLGRGRGSRRGSAQREQRNRTIVQGNLDIDQREVRTPAGHRHIVHETGTGNDEADHVIEVGVVVETANPRRVGWTGIGEDGQAGDEEREHECPRHGPGAAPHGHSPTPSGGRCQIWRRGPT